MPPREEHRAPVTGSAAGIQGRIAATYDYRDERRELLFQVVRFEPKDFRPRRPSGDGWIWNLGDVRRVLYRLPDLLAAKPDEPVFVVEGEKDVDTLVRLGLCATTSPGGAGKWRPEYSKALDDRQVVILPDNDEPGRKHAADVTQALAGRAASVTVVELPGLPPKGDVSDWLAKGGTTAALLSMVETAPLVREATREGESSDESRGAKVTAAQVVPLPSAAWPDSQPLPEGLLTVPAFDDRLLPEALRPWLSDVAERTQCPPEYAAVGAIVAMSSLVGRSCGIRPKRHDDWTVIPNLWGGVVGPPSSMKTPALTEALRPLHRLALRAREDYERRIEGHAAMLAEAKARRTVVDTKMKKAAKVSADMTDLRAEYMQAADPDEPNERRYIVNDATVEKLGELLNQNPRGLLHFRDELTGWLANLERDGHENDRAFFLEAWNGAGRYTYDRIGRGTLHIEAPCVSMLGGIQPGPLARYLRATVRGGIGDDGLMQRFQLLVYPDPPATWRNVDRWPDTDGRNRAFEVFERLDTLTSDRLAAEGNDTGIPFLRFDADAQRLSDQWRESLMARLRGGHEHAAIEAHLAKYPSLLPSLALLFHLADAGTPGPVTLVPTQRAAAWCDLLEGHARRVYSIVTAENFRAARALLHKLRTGALGCSFTKRDVYRAGWSGLADRELVAEALEALEDYGWVRRTVTAETGGRPRTEYTAHPSLGASAAKAVAE
jgi:putative DNA primase/helicase